MDSLLQLHIHSDSLKGKLHGIQEAAKTFASSLCLGHWRHELLGMNFRSAYRLAQETSSNDTPGADLQTLLDSCASNSPAHSLGVPPHLLVLPQGCLPTPYALHSTHQQLQVSNLVLERLQTLLESASQHVESLLEAIHCYTQALPSQPSSGAEVRHGL